MSKTEKDLMTAFAGESQANRKYLAYAREAEKQGLTQVARLFRAAAASETVHALMHLKNAGKIGDTKANLQDAIKGETYEYTEMYPEMIKDAQAEDKKAVAAYFGLVEKVEELHANMFKKALEDPAALPDTDYYICSYCGYVHKGPMSEKCPVCGAPPSAFKPVEDYCK